MLGSARRARFILLTAPLSLLPLASCSEEGDGGAGGGDPVYSSREELEVGAGGAGGIGGAGGAGPVAPDGPIRMCTPDVVTIDGLPECFVAEVSSRPLDCTAPGHEELRASREDAARERECAYRSLDQAECAALSLCGLIKATGNHRSACQTGAASTAPGYCSVDERTDGCASAEVDTLLAYGVSPDAEALHISCAVVGSE